MKQLLSLREQHGGVYATALPDGRVVPWKPLSIGEHLEYDRLFQAGQHTSAFLEDEIFRLCVLDPVLVSNIDILRAGDITTVVSNILAVSGPGTGQDVALALQIGRMQVAGNLLYDLISLVCQAFPAIKPFELEQMEYMELMKWVAVAEQKLLQTGMLEQPLEFVDPNQEPQQRTTQMPPPPPPPPSDLRRQYKKQQGIEQTVITQGDIQEHQAAYTGHEKSDKIINDQQMIEETAAIYQEYIDQMAKGEKLAIKTPEEKQAAADEQLKKSKVKYDKMMTEKAEKELEAEKAAERKMKRAAKRRPKRKR